MNQDLKDLLKANAGTLDVIEDCAGQDAAKAVYLMTFVARNHPMMKRVRWSSGDINIMTGGFIAHFCELDGSLDWSLVEPRLASQSITAWPKSVAQISIRHQDGREAVFHVAASVNADIRCGRTDEPRLHIFVHPPEKTVKVAGKWKPKP